MKKRMIAVFVAGLVMLPSCVQARGHHHVGQKHVHRHVHRHQRPLFWDWPVRFVMSPRWGHTKVIVPQETKVVYVTEQAPLQATPFSATYVGEEGLLCRTYKAQAVIGGVSQPVYGQACMQPDGSWRVMR